MGVLAERSSLLPVAVSSRYGSGRLVRYRPVDDVFVVELKFGMAYLCKDSINTDLGSLLWRLKGKDASSVKGYGGGGGGDGGEGGGGGGGGGGCLQKVMRGADQIDEKVGVFEGGGVLNYWTPKLVINPAKRHSSYISDDVRTSSSFTVIDQRNHTALLSPETTQPTATTDDRVQAFLSRTQRNSPQQHPSNSSRSSSRWAGCVGTATALAMAALAVVMLLVTASFTIGFKYGTMSSNLENSHLQLAQVKFDEALSHFERTCHVNEDFYQQDYERFLTEQAGVSVDLFDRSTTSLGHVAADAVRATRTSLQATLLQRQLQLAAHNGVKGTQVVEEEWEYDDRALDTAMDECRCRAVLLSRAGRQRVTRADGSTSYTDWSDHGQIGQCTWKEMPA
eukprot:GHVS01030678.1.p1 GENE.GHVS01030678.1~~GHVS01030678.1.p1  ORF type:complete len:394 (+),score=105.22 GHVS01030678.1:132-1313(+)